MKEAYHARRRARVFISGAILGIGLFVGACGVTQNNERRPSSLTNTTQPESTMLPAANQIAKTELLSKLASLSIKGRASKTGYSRDEFGKGWASSQGCETRQAILRRDLTSVALSADGCDVMTGILQDPYTGKQIAFTKGVKTSADVQIDHVVALSDAWQKGAQLLDKSRRVQLANDPIELLAVDGPSNEQKGDGDAATWLPSNKAFRCSYVSQQILVKSTYELWVTQAEHDAMDAVLTNCPDTIGVTK